MTVDILILCTGNSARSIFGEVLINQIGAPGLRAYSAGSQPTGKVNPAAIEKLEREGHPTAGLESKSWDRFSGPGAPPFDVVITVCDSAAGESCPIWNGAPVTVHWGIPDPAADGDFDAAYARLRGRIEAMSALPLETMSTAQLREELSAIHASAASSP